MTSSIEKLKHFVETNKCAIAGSFLASVFFISTLVFFILNALDPISPWLSPLIGVSAAFFCCMINQLVKKFNKYSDASTNTVSLSSEQRGTTNLDNPPSLQSSTIVSSSTEQRETNLGTSVSVQPAMTVSPVTERRDTMMNLDTLASVQTPAIAIRNTSIASIPYSATDVNNSNHIWLKDLIHACDQGDKGKIESILAREEVKDRYMRLSGFHSEEHFQSFKKSFTNQSSEMYTELLELAIDTEDEESYLWLQKHKSSFINQNAFKYHRTLIALAIDRHCFKIAIDLIKRGSRTDFIFSGDPSQDKTSTVDPNAIQFLQSILTRLKKNTQKYSECESLILLLQSNSN